MMPVARMGDMGYGICTPHKDPHMTTGMIVTSQGTVLINGMPAARMGDMVIVGDGGVGVIVSGSANVLIGGMPMAQLGSTFVGSFTGTIISGSGNVYCK